MTTYAQQPVWREIQKFLPEAYQIKPGQEPGEEWWTWERDRIHLDTYRNPRATVKVILFHGLGTNGRQIMAILGAPLARRGYESIAIDMPGYGLTEVGDGHLVSYEDWVQAGSDVIDAELARADRPIFLYGFSAGGMLTYDVAAKSRKVKGIVGMTFFDNREQFVRDTASRNLFTSRVGGPAMHLLAKTPLHSMRIRMRDAIKMNALVNNKGALRVFLKDPTSAGNAMTTAFLASYLSHVPVVEPEDFDVCPILLTQPAADHWTPLNLSQPFLKRIRKVPVKTVMLENAGHYPLEEPGLTTMVESIDAFYRSVAAPRSSA